MTGRPLLITDCDEVLLHMVAHFQDWLGEAHAIDFAFETGSFAAAARKLGLLVCADRLSARPAQRLEGRDFAASP